jgi:hypothetical protein
MKDISQEAVDLAMQGAPKFVQRINQAGGSVLPRRRVRVTSTLNAFEDDPMLLYACLWYACSCGVEIVLRPEPRDS